MNTSIQRKKLIEVKSQIKILEEEISKWKQKTQKDLVNERKINSYVVW